MEATGICSKPVCAILEDEFDCLLVNARHVKQVPGRKTDAGDAAWLCQEQLAPFAGAVELLCTIPGVQRRTAEVIPLNLRMIGLMPRATPLAARNDTPKVGARVRSLRRERGLTIEQLAAATALTKGFISQLERDRTAPSLSSIARICDALGVRLSHIFEREPAPALVRRHERVPVDTAFSTENHLLSSRDEERFQAIESEVAPGAGAGDELSSLPGEMEFVYVLEGTLEMRVADETHVLEQGDALTYPLSKPHTWRNASDTKVLRVLWVSVPNPY